MSSPGAVARWTWLKFQMKILNNLPSSATRYPSTTHPPSSTTETPNQSPISSTIIHYRYHHPVVIQLHMIFQGSADTPRPLRIDRSDGQLVMIPNSWMVSMENPTKQWDDNIWIHMIAGGSHDFRKSSYLLGKPMALQCPVVFFLVKPVTMFSSVARIRGQWKSLCPALMLQGHLDHPE